MNVLTSKSPDDRLAFEGLIAEQHAMHLLEESLSDVDEVPFAESYRAYRATMFGDSDEPVEVDSSAIRTAMEHLTRSF